MDHPHEMPGSRAPSRVELIRRRKTGGPATHYGVRIWWSPLESQVYDFQYTNEVRRLTTAEFSAGLPVQVEQSLLDADAVSNAWARMQRILDGKWKYDPLKQNCEHVARYVISGDLKSDQTRLVWFAAGIAFLLIVAR